MIKKIYLFSQASIARGHTTEATFQEEAKALNKIWLVVEQRSQSYEK